MASYEIGYGKPPLSGRFRAGVSGNPKRTSQAQATPARRAHQDRAQCADRISGAGQNQGRDLSRTEPQDARRPRHQRRSRRRRAGSQNPGLAPSATAIRASTRFWSRTGSPTIPVKPPTRKPPNSRPGATPRLPNGGRRPRIDRKSKFAMSVPSTARGRRISLGQLHFGQLMAHWALQPHRFKALRCGRRFGKTEFAKTWIAQGLVQGEECAWFAPQHMTWTEVYSDLTQMLGPILDASSRAPPVIRLSNGGRIDFWSLENPIAGRGRRYRRIVIDEAAFTKDGDNRSDDSMMALWEKGIKPTLFDYGGEALVCSNSAGKNPDNFFYNICTDPQYGFHEFHATTLDNPLLPKRARNESLEDWRRAPCSVSRRSAQGQRPAGLRPGISGRVRRLVGRRVLQPRKAPR